MYSLARGLFSQFSSVLELLLSKLSNNVVLQLFEKIFMLDSIQKWAREPYSRNREGWEEKKKELLNNRSFQLSCKSRVIVLFCLLILIWCFTDIHEVCGFLFYFLLWIKAWDFFLLIVFNWDVSRRVFLPKSFFLFCFHCLLVLVLLFL